MVLYDPFQSFQFVKVELAILISQYLRIFQITHLHFKDRTLNGAILGVLFM